MENEFALIGRANICYIILKNNISTFYWTREHNTKAKTKHRLQQQAKRKINVNITIVGYNVGYCICVQKKYALDSFFLLSFVPCKRSYLKLKLVIDNTLTLFTDGVMKSMNILIISTVV